MGYGKQISYNTIGNVVTLFAQWLIIMMIPMITDFQEAGVFAVAISVASILNQIATFTLNQYQVVDQYERYSENDYALARLTTVVMSFVCIIPISLVFGYGLSQIMIILVYTIYRNLINYAYLHQSAMQIINRLDYAGKCLVLEGICSFAVFIGTYVMLTDLFISTALMAAVGGGIFMATMSEGYKRFFGHRYGIHLKNWDNLVPLLAIGAPLLVSTMCPIVITALPKLILEYEWGTEIVGYFSTLTSPTIIIPTLAQAIFMPYIVYFAKICREKDMRKLRIQYSKILGVMAIGAVACYILSVLFAGAAFELIYGEEITAYVGYFNILIVGIFFYSVGICGITVLITKKQGQAAGLSSAIALVFSIIIFTMWIPIGGMNAATWGLLYSYGVFGAVISLCIYLLPLTGSSEAEA